MKRGLRILALLFLAVPGAALAYGSASGDLVTVPKDETRNGTYYAVGSQVNIAGTINGDLVCAGSNITVTGAVHGDVLCAGQTVSITGPVDGSVRVAGQTVSLGGKVNRNVMAASQSFIATDGFNVAGDLGLAAQSATLDGEVARDVYGYLQSLEITGTVGAVNVSTQNIVLGQISKVKGDLRYASSKQLQLDNARVDGTVRFQHVNHGADKQNTAFGVIAGRAYWIFSSLVVAAVFVWLVPGMMRRVTSLMHDKPSSSVGLGAISILVLPVLVVVLLITLIGAPLALLMAIIWGVALAVSPIFAGTAAGLWFLKKIDWNSGSLWWAAGFGTFVLMALTALPIVGTFIAIGTASWALGGMVLAVRAARA